jgi:TrmH family RNA methyltransferase
MKIESLTNKHVKEWVKLKNKKYRDEVGLFLVEGDHLINEALKKGLIKEIISTDNQVKADYYVTDEIMKKISNQVSISSSVAVVKKLEEKEISGKILVLDDIQDPGNLGTIIRSAVAFNFSTIILSNNSVDVYNDKVIRSSEGMIFHINIIRKNIIEFLKEMKDKYLILVTDVVDGENIKKYNKTDNVILIIGNEGNGVSNEVKTYANHKIKLNMNKSCESLNAGVAASILMYELQGDMYE